MKIRTSYVANSSSSSFIIAYRNVDAVTEEIKPVWIKPMISKLVSVVTKNGNTISTIEELDAFIVGQYGSRDDTLQDVFESEGEYVIDKYNNMKNAIEKGFVVADIDVDYNDESLSEMLECLPRLNFEEPLTLIQCNN